MRHCAQDDFWDDDVDVTFNVIGSPDSGNGNASLELARNAGYFWHGDTK